MINLLAVSYNNIGPFKDKILTVFFDQGKYLIKAPIGAGKSFLFFDGPIYGLYKYSARNMLNNQSKSGYIKLLFEIEGQTYLIVRNLTKGKSKESCATTLYEIQGGEYKTSSAGIIEGDLEHSLKEQGLKTEEVTFKNETDLQQTLNTLLPPREVFLNTVFLMQDSENIFELQPADRLTVLKNVFNLIGIDEAKDKIAERKKEIWYKLKATADTSKYDEKLKRLLTDYISNYKKVNSEQLITNSEWKTFFEDLENIYEKVNIAEFSADDFPVTMHEEIDEKVEKKKSEYQKLAHQLSTLQGSLKEEEVKIRNEENKKRQLISDSEKLTVKIEAINPKKIDELKKQKKEVQTKQNSLEAGINKEAMLAFYAANKKNLEDSELNEELGIADAYLFIQQLKNIGKVLQEEIKNIQLQSKYSADTLKDLEQQLKEIEKKITLFDEDVDQQASFACEKIETNCPFIKVINKKTFEQLDKQKELLQKEKIALEAKVKALKIMPSASSAEKEKFMENIKKFLQEIDWKHIETLHEEAGTLIKTEKSIDQQIQALESDIEKLEDYKQQITTLKVELTQTEKQIKDAEGRLQMTEKEKTTIDNQIKNSDYSSVLELEKLNTKMKEDYRDINSLVHEFKDVQIQVKQLQQEEEVVNNLYIIFSKELLLLVLQDHLPVLSDIINTYLAQVVEYQITFSLHKSSTDKLELLAQIFDDKGERDVKSLSGGQRVILKIVWMLAISSYIHSPVLFIDETINNLDADTVAKVSDMLEDFVKSKSMKLYAVTHNQQIQDMKFWDKVIELS